jgi:peptidoglycan LD-endopeptidase CwlK
MYKFSKSSQDKLNTCHPFLQEICNELIKEADFVVICGYRDKAAQDDAYSKGASKLKFPQSKHNKKPSLAVDIAPYNQGIDWNNHIGFQELAKKFKQIAEHKNIPVVWGGDWQMRDMPHFELVL